MARADRLQSLIAHLADGQMHRARDLAARLGVSERTIWRDMAELQAFGVPVTGSRGVGYMLRRAVALRPLVLSPDELAALDHLLRLAEAHADTRIGAGARSLAAKIRAALPATRPEATDPGQDRGGDQGQGRTRGAAEAHGQPHGQPHGPARSPSPGPHPSPHPGPRPAPEAPPEGRGTMPPAPLARPAAPQ